MRHHENVHKQVGDFAACYGRRSGMPAGWNETYNRSDKISAEQQAGWAEMDCLEEKKQSMCAAGIAGASCRRELTERQDQINEWINHGLPHEY